MATGGVAAEPVVYEPPDASAAQRKSEILQHIDDIEVQLVTQLVFAMACIDQTRTAGLCSLQPTSLPPLLSAVYIK